MTDDHPTDAEKADAVLRLLDEIDAAHAILGRARAILQEGGTRTRASHLFPYVGEQVLNHLDAARSALWAVSNDVAPQFLAARRAITKEEV